MALAFRVKPVNLFEVFSLFTRKRVCLEVLELVGGQVKYKDTSPIRNSSPLPPYSRPRPRTL